MALDSGKKEAVIRSIQRLMQIEKDDELRAALPELVESMEAYTAFAPGWHLLGKLQWRLGDSDVAFSSFHKAIQLAPENADFVGDYGDALYQAKQYEKLIEVFEPLLPHQPENHRLRYLFGMAHAKLKRIKAAYDLLGALPIEAHLSGQDWYEIGEFFLRVAINYEKSGAAFRRAIQLDPNNYAPRVELGFLHAAEFEFEQAAMEMKKSVELCHRPWTCFSNYLLVSAYYLNLDPQELLRRHREWDALSPQVKLKNPIRKHRNRARPLRIGYVSGDFRKHVVWGFIEPVIRNHDRSRVSIHCYHTWNNSDARTEHLRGFADEWIEINKMTAQVAADRIRKDEIDVLVDLSGHSAWNRLDVFAQRCAPVQASYLGYIATTGLEQMDVRISDGVLTPEDTPELFSEQVWRLPRCYKAFRPYMDAPEIQTRAGQRELVFGSLHRLSKITDATIDMWAGVLAALPEAKLLITRHELRDERSRSRLLERFRVRGVSESQLCLQFRWKGNHLGLYNEMDISLDAFPVTGGATTAESLWMGVPVITRAGQVTRERNSASILHGVGMPEWIAHSNDEFIRIALRLAEQVRQPSYSKMDLRQQFIGSDLGDGASLARSLEDAYFSML